MSQFGMQQGSGAKYEAIILPFSIHPAWQALNTDSYSLAYAALLNSQLAAVIAMLNKVDYLLDLYLLAAEEEQDRRPSQHVNDLCLKLRGLQVCVIMTDST